VNERAQKKTPLYDEHVKRGAKMVPFAGWLMPVQYTGIVEEHQAVRNSVGIFDISHMGQFVISGSGAATWLNTMLTNSIEKLDVGQGQYTFLLNDAAGIIDDLIVYRIGHTNFCWSLTQRVSKKTLRGWADIGARMSISGSQRAFRRSGIQGPRVAELFVNLPARNHIVDVEMEGMSVSIARTGYTGEDGIEVFFSRKMRPTFGTQCLKRKRSRIKPCGLGARDTLRLEMCYPLNGSDLSPKRNPIEAGLGFFVDLTKPNFIGRDILLKTKENGPHEKLVPFKMQGKGPPPRPHYSVFENGERIGEVTSGTQSPSLNWGVGMAYIKASHARIGAKIEIEIRGQKFPAAIEKKPLYKKS